MSEPLLSLVIDAIEEPEYEPHPTRTQRLVKRLRRDDLYDFVRKVAHRYGATVEAVLSRDRHHSVSNARHAVCYALRYGLEDRELSYPEIGRLLGRDHTTVINSIKTHAKRKTIKIQRRPPLLARTSPKLLPSGEPMPEIPDLVLPAAAVVA
jgi:hypothetical protein